MSVSPMRGMRGGKLMLFDTELYAFGKKEARLCLWTNHSVI